MPLLEDIMGENMHKTYIIEALIIGGLIGGAILWSGYQHRSMQPQSITHAIEHNIGNCGLDDFELKNGTKPHRMHKEITIIRDNETGEKGKIIMKFNDDDSDSQKIDIKSLLREAIEDEAITREIKKILSDSEVDIDIQIDIDESEADK